MPINRLSARGRYPAPGLSFDWTPWVDLCVIGFFVALAYSRFMVPVGVGINLPATQEHSYANLDTTAVLTIKNHDLIFFEGEKLGLQQLERRFDDYRQTGEIAKATLLVKADGSVSTQTLLALCDLAQQAGFASIQVATEIKTPPDDRF